MRLSRILPSLPLRRNSAKFSARSRKRRRNGQVGSSTKKCMLHCPVCMLKLFQTQFLFRSNTLFNVWNSYEAKLPAGYYTKQLLATGDLFYKKGLYQLASVHCYGRSLTSLGVQGNHNLVQILHNKSMDTITATVSKNNMGLCIVCCNGNTDILHVHMLL